MIKVNDKTLEILRERSQWTNGFGCPLAWEGGTCVDRCGRIFPEIASKMTVNANYNNCPCFNEISSERVVQAMKEIIEFNT